jgi:tight adherence protein B
MLLMLIFALGLLLMAAALLFFVLMASRQERTLLEKRINLIFSTLMLHAAKAARAPGAPQLAAERLRRIVSLGLSHTWGTRTNATTLLLLAALAALIVWTLAGPVLHFSSWIALPAALAALVLLPRFLLKREQSKAEKAFTSLFPDAVDMGVRMLRAGLPITAAVRAIGEEAAPPVNGVFKTLADQVEIGIPFEQALAATGEEVGLPDFRFFSVAVALQRATGGNLASTLEILSEIMRKRRAVRLKAQATTGEVRVSAYILGAIPFAVLGILLLVQPGYLAPLLTDPRGKIIIGAASAMLLLGFLTMRRMMRRAVRL